MKKKVSLFLLLLFAVGFCFADPAEGYWLSVDDKSGEVTAGWMIAVEGGKLNGRLLSAPGLSRSQVAARCRESYPGFPISGRVNQMTVAGTPWIFGLSMDKPGEWSGGNVINPEDGRIYRCKIIFHPADGRRYSADTLEMRGEIGLGLGRSQFWRKSDRETAGSL